MTYSMESGVYRGDQNWAYLFINGDQLMETIHKTYSESGQVNYTSGLVWTLEANAGDKIEIRTTKMDRYYKNIYFCAEFIPKI